MSFLAPLFFVAGAAIAAPIIFHLIRRETKSRMVFSSLMFLKPSPPRVTRRSRIDNWLLLLLRALAILLVAAAFTRPFFRTLGETTAVRPTAFTVVLVDESASMKRDDLWRQAIARVEAELQQTQASDRIAIATFDDSVEVLRGLQAVGQDSPEAAIADLKSRAPSWMQSDLGGALMAGVEMIDETMRGEDESTAQQTIVVISDLQQSSRIDALRGTEWPKSIQVRFAPVTPKSTTNASLIVSSLKDAILSQSSTQSSAQSSLQTDETADEDANRNLYRARIENSSGASVGTFSLQWLDSKYEPIESVSAEASSINVPPGANRMVNLVAPRSEAVALTISGDDYDFDNRYYVIVPEPLEQRIVMIGNNVEDARDSLYYYLEKLPLDKPGRTIETELVPAEQFAARFAGLSAEEPLDPKQIPLIVINDFLPAAEMEQLRSYVESGGKVLAVLDQTAAKSPKTEAALKILTKDTRLRIQPAELEDYAIMSRVNFKSEVFAALADPRYSDFSKIQFWSHTNLAIGQQSADDGIGDSSRLQADADWKVLASFDGGKPALARQDIVKGSVYVLAAGWQPTESQLALSTKFVPMISGIVGDPDRGGAWESVVLGESVTLPPSSTAKLVLPNGDKVDYANFSDAEAIDQPGIYRWEDGEQSRSFAANMPSAESDFRVMDRSVLEQLGVKFEDGKKEAVLEAGERQKRDSELEQQQSLWRWLLVTALGLIGLETFLGSRRGTQIES